MMPYYHYTVLADLFRYPGNNYPDVVAHCRQIMQEQYPEAVQDIDVFADYINSHTADEREELYTKTFDVQPICYLDLGYVLFGEDYKRGVFLLHMQHEQQKACNDCGTDLADNLCNMLTLFHKTRDQQLMNELVVKILIPGVKKMIAEFAQARVELKTKVLKKLHRAIIQEELNNGNVYRHVFLSLLRILEKDFENIRFEKPAGSITDLQRHQSFFSKQSVYTEIINQQKNAVEINNLVNNYKLD
ncbi:MAG: hypothetical protein JST43_14455 [Bacteroidetes bacterium]|nr:hypothetical protein [Bacteroidota bacterium]MBS1541266.1 hypothetical protein [Bacteroidota bacterium]